MADFDRVQQIVARALGVDAAQITPHSGREQFAQWDSMGQLNIVMELEADLGVSLTTEQALGLDSIPAVMAAVASSERAS